MLDEQDAKVKLSTQGVHSFSCVESGNRFCFFFFFGGGGVFRGAPVAYGGFQVRVELEL